MIRRYWSAVLCSAWMNEHGSGVDYTKLDQRGSYTEAERDGWTAVDSDDFLVVQYDEFGEMRDLVGDGNRQLDWEPEHYAPVAEALGLKYATA